MLRHDATTITAHVTMTSQKIINNFPNSDFWWNRRVKRNRRTLKIVLSREALTVNIRFPGIRFPATFKIRINLVNPQNHCSESRESFKALQCVFEYWQAGIQILQLSWVVYGNINK